MGIFQKSPFLAKVEAVKCSSLDCNMTHTTPHRVPHTKFKLWLLLQPKHTVWMTPSS